ncbi:hypothetical protein PoB_002563300 [Plakobranchus ocellatus]|uniref:Uncharacterized protein n=1 Tax=Plakobranchus ocellatus TaxID=259542 RepID=A0AAV3ZXI7_9GAST|nr:hypothetical protein PoB_002563300 [Plakobranchus ocellatus]
MTLVSNLDKARTNRTTQTNRFSHHSPSLLHVLLVAPDTKKRSDGSILQCVYLIAFSECSALPCPYSLTNLRFWFQISFRNTSDPTLYNNGRRCWSTSTRYCVCSEQPLQDSSEQR